MVEDVDILAGEPARPSEVRRAARALAEAGRAADAVDLLTRAVRHRPDARNEMLLVHLRHQAYLEQASTDPRQEWPRQMADPFPDVSGAAPEVEADDLTSDVLGGAIVHHGCLLVRGLVRPKVAARLADHIDRAFDACDRRNDGAPVADTRPWYVPFQAPGHTLTYGERWWIRQGEGVWTADSPRLFHEVVEAFRPSGLVDVIGGYLGERPALSVKKCTLRRVPVETGTDWHQDGAFLGDRIRSVNTWLALSHCGDRAPGLDIVPTRLDLLPTGTDGAQFDWSVGPGAVARASGRAGVASPTFAPGDALLFDERFLHRTGVRPGMDQVRYAVESWFFAPSHYPDDQIPLAV